MSEAQTKDDGELLDWESVRVKPLPVSGFMLYLEGIAPRPMTVKLVPLPIGIVAEDYAGIEVRGFRKEPTTEVETPWSIHTETSNLPHGKKGFMLKGATKTEYIPPKDS